MCESKIAASLEVLDLLFTVTEIDPICALQAAMDLVLKLKKTLLLEMLI
jgi:S-adenosylhomocysteine hydrolase